jgi:hypothetical protein
VEGADLLAYPGWRGQCLQTVGEVEESAWGVFGHPDAVVASRSPLAGLFR